MDPKEANTFETVMGGADLVVRHRDGTDDTVKVLQLPIADYPRLLASLENEEAQLELYCGKPTGWAGTLSLQSHNALMEKAEELNGDFFSRWAKRRLAKMEVLRPGAMDKLFDGAAAAVQRQPQKPTLGSSLPKSPLPPG